MTAGMAANRPMAVATSASAMPGATCASVACATLDRPRKAYAFRGLSNVAQATLAQVAPGIAEALVATAMGLFAAIPAVIAYNRFAHDIDRLAGRYESFMEELQNILQRQAHLPDRDMAATGAHRVK